MVWSFSRLTTYERCPYSFLLQYILRLPQAPNFYLEFGTLVHDILAKYYRHELEQPDLLPEFLTRFYNEVPLTVPPNTYGSFMSQAIAYLRTAPRLYLNPEAIELPVDFKIDSIRFTGVVDLIARDDDKLTVILDHKSTPLKPRTTKGKHTKSDKELDDYLRQLYLYAIPVHDMFGEYPRILQFNCYRNGNLITEPFDLTAFEATKRWALETVENINTETRWRPAVDYWRCKNLCSLRQHCEYSELQKT
jgi:hypothetical protein